MSDKKKWPAYQASQIEAKWRQFWEGEKIYHATKELSRPKFYCLDFFPYPSGEGLHVGHCRNYIPTDVISRYKRMQGFNVLHPMGWDAFGEPAEQHAVLHGVHPRLTTDQNTANFRRQMELIGTSYDWSREIDSSKPEFYHWTQYFFLQLYRKGLAYRDTNWQWWCPTCQTTLSSHEISDGVCWRGHTGVIRKEIPAWYFRITAYADQLLEGLDGIDWPENIKAMQRNWIGRSEGFEIIFMAEEDFSIPVFTTRPDTIFGATFLILAPEHPLVDRLTQPEQRTKVAAYCEQALRSGEVERMMENRVKTGVFSGSYAVNPLSEMLLPIWIADYVLPTYGSGAIMGVPAHDQRDFDFATNFDLPIQTVVIPDGEGELPDKQVFTQKGILINSGVFNGLHSDLGAKLVCEELQKRDLGKAKITYRMRDWLISRQRYWGTPIPIVYCKEHGEQPMKENQLPVILPYMENFKPDGSGLSPLARVPEFVNTSCPLCGEPAKRETDTMGGFACSSWYFLRFTSPWEQQNPFDPAAVRYWMPVDLYVGGAEHAILHLLYARFWTHALADSGILDFREPFLRLRNQGQLLAADGSRMSKSRGNVITPDEIVAQYSADALRVYELFMAPFDQDIQWSVEGINGSMRFLRRVWNLFSEVYHELKDVTGQDEELLVVTHQTIRVVGERIEAFRLNTVVSAMMEFINLLTERLRSGRWQTATFRDALEKLILLLAPIAPYISEEIWHLTEHMGSIHEQSWPDYDLHLTKTMISEIPVQVDGRLRDVISIDNSDDEAAIRELALARPKVQAALAGKETRSIVYVPGKIINIVSD